MIDRCEFRPAHRARAPPCPVAPGRRARRQGRHTGQSRPRPGDRPRRAAGDRGARRARLPRLAHLPARRVRGRGHVLRALRLPHHHRPGPRCGRGPGRGAGHLLDEARPTTHPGHADGARGHHRARVAGGGRVPRGPGPPMVRRPDLHQQLGDDPRGRGLLQPRLAATVRAPVVPGDRGAVLHPLAPAPLGAAPAHLAAAQHGELGAGGGPTPHPRGRGRGRGLRGVDGLGLVARVRAGPPLLRHGHPRLRPAVRRVRGDRPGPCAPARARRPRAADLGHAGGRRVGRRRGARGGLRPGRRRPREHVPRSAGGPVRRRRVHRLARGAG